MKKNVIEFNFTLVVSGANEETDGLEDALFNAGCDDALIYFKNGVTYLEFDRTASDMKDAILSAISQVESTRLGIKVIRVEPDDLVNASEIARRTAKSREAIRKMIENSVAFHNFPAPILVQNDRSTLWSWFTVSEWMQKNHKLDNPLLVEEAAVLCNLNTALECRHTGAYLSEFINILAPEFAFKHSSPIYKLEPIKSNPSKLRKALSPMSLFSVTAVNYDAARQSPKWGSCINQ